jgi:hypothetical protein
MIGASLYKKKVKRIISSEPYVLLNVSLQCDAIASQRQSSNIDPGARYKMLYVFGENKWRLAYLDSTAFISS